MLGSRVTAPPTLNLGSMWRWVVSFMPRPLYPRGRIPVLTEQETGWAPHADWTFSERENSLVPTGVPTLVCLARSIVPVPTELVKYYAVFWKLLNSYRHIQFSEIRMSRLFRFGIIWGGYCRCSLTARITKHRLYSAEWLLTIRLVKTIWKWSVLDAVEVPSWYLHAGTKCRTPLKTSV